MKECQDKNWVESEREGREEDSDVEMGGDPMCSTAVESTPPSSPDTTTESISTSSPETLSSFLGDVVSVIEYLQESAGGRGRVVSALKGTPELGAQILGDYLENLHKAMLQNQGTQHSLGGVEPMIGVWKGCVYGNGDLKKVSQRTELMVVGAHDIWSGSNNLFKNLPISIIQHSGLQVCKYLPYRTPREARSRLRLRTSSHGRITSCTSAA